MSDPVTNVEIEDVLSSIRRLVSEGDRGRSAESEPEKQDDDMAAEEAAKPEALVLTPALRVAGTDDAADEEATDESEGPTAAAETHDAPEPHRDDTVTEGHQSEGVAESAEAEGDPAENQAGLTDRTTLEATIAELEAAVSDQPFEWEPDGSEEAEPVVWPSMGRQNVAAEEAELSDGAEAEDEAHAAGEARDLVEEEAQDAVWHVEPDLAPQSANTSDTENEVTATLGDPVPPLAAETEDETDWPGDAAYAEDDLDSVLAGDGTIDEALLRELVAEIVREELQGTLGERITRNVRKLVRREIHRVLSSQELD